MDHDPTTHSPATNAAADPYREPLDADPEPRRRTGAEADAGAADLPASNGAAASAGEGIEVAPLTIPGTSGGEGSVPSAAEGAQSGVYGAAAASGAASLDSILLPGRERPGETPYSAQRVNAAAVLEAADAPLEREAPPPEPVAPPPRKPGLAAIRTYKSDVEQTVESNNFSLATIAAAKSRESENDPERGRTGVLNRVLELAAGVMFLAAALGAVAFALLRPAPAPQQAAPASLIYVDATAPVEVSARESRDELMRALTDSVANISIAAGLIEKFDLAVPAPAGSNEVSHKLTAQDFFALVAPAAPTTLRRALAPEFLLGVHSFAGNQPLLIFKTDSYEQAFAGMLAWEATMPEDLAPLFPTPAPAPVIAQPSAATESAATSSNSASSTGQSSTAAHGSASSASSSSESQNALLALPNLGGAPSRFVDRVLANHDTRVIEDTSGSTALLWTFIDRHTLVIAANENTLKEIIARPVQAPVVPIVSTQQ